MARNVNIAFEEFFENIAVGPSTLLFSCPCYKYTKSNE